MSKVIENRKIKKKWATDYLSSKKNMEFQCTQLLKSKENFINKLNLNEFRYNQGLSDKKTLNYIEGLDLPLTVKQVFYLNYLPMTPIDNGTLIEKINETLFLLKEASKKFGNSGNYFNSYNYNNFFKENVHLNFDLIHWFLFKKYVTEHSPFNYFVDNYNSHFSSILRDRNYVKLYYFHVFNEFLEHGHDDELLKDFIDRFDEVLTQLFTDFKINNYSHTQKLFDAHDYDPIWSPNFKSTRAIIELYESYSKAHYVNALKSSSSSRWGSKIFKPYQIENLFTNVMTNAVKKKAYSREKVTELLNFISSVGISRLSNPREHAFSVTEIINENKALAKMSDKRQDRDSITVIIDTVLDNLDSFTGSELLAIPSLISKSNSISSDKNTELLSIIKKNIEQHGVLFLKFACNVIVSRTRKLPTANNYRNIKPELLEMPLDIALPLIGIGKTLNSSAPNFFNKIKDQVNVNMYE